MKVSAAIIAHPKRKDYVAELREQLDAPVVWDTRNSMWDTSSRAILSYDPTADYHLIVDDDAIPAPDLIAGCERMVEYLPFPTLVGLFVGEDHRLPGLLEGHKGQGGDFKLKDVSFLRLGGVLNWGVATLIPVDWIPDLIDYCATLRFPEVDRRMGTFANAMRYQTLYTWPSLVDHREGPSLRRADFKRVAINYSDKSALIHDWSGHILALPFDSRIPYTAQDLMDARRRRSTNLTAAQRRQRRLTSSNVRK